MATQTDGTFVPGRRQVGQSKCLWPAYPHVLLDLHIETVAYGELREARRRQVGGKHMLRVPL